MPSLNWIGKDAVVNHDKEVPFRLLKKVKSSSVGENSHNLIVHGDNLEALKALMPHYAGKVKCIYIDPPYNTGNEGWVYNDKVNSPKVNKWLGRVVGDETNDLCRHDKWLCMMYPRLKLLHQFLKTDGIIYISIDDHENQNLLYLMDEVFGEDNFLANLIWDLGSGTSAGHFTRAHEYIVAYAKSKESLPNFSGGEGIIEDRAIKKIGIKNPASAFVFPAGTRVEAEDGFTRKGEWGKSEKVRLLKGNFVVMKGALKEAVTLEAGWTQKKQMESWFNGTETRDSKGQPVLEFFFNDKGILRCRKSRRIINPPSIIRNIGSTRSGSSELNQLFDGEKMFDFPKPPELIKYFLSLNTGGEDIILDSFAGSGTTGHAVLDLNKEDGGNRKFILVEMEDQVAKEITAERVKRAIEKNDYKDGFEYCELSKPLFDEHGQIEASCDFKQFATYIYFTETQTNIDQAKISGNFIGDYRERDFYLIYKDKGSNVLDKYFLEKLKDSGNAKVIYADRCTLEDDELAVNKIIFKQIPYEVKVY